MVAATSSRATIPPLSLPAKFVAYSGTLCSAAFHFSDLFSLAGGEVGGRPASPSLLFSCIRQAYMPHHSFRGAKFLGSTEGPSSRASERKRQCLSIVASWQSSPSASSCSRRQGEQRARRQQLPTSLNSGTPWFPSSSEGEGISILGEVMALLRRMERKGRMDGGDLTRGELIRKAKAHNPAFVTSTPWVTPWGAHSYDLLAQADRHGKGKE